MLGMTAGPLWLQLGQDRNECISLEEAFTCRGILAEQLNVKKCVKYKIFTNTIQISNYLLYYTYLKNKYFSKITQGWDNNKVPKLKNVLQLTY